jgi:hypothetical protein
MSQGRALPLLYAVGLLAAAALAATAGDAGWLATYAAVPPLVVLPWTLAFAAAAALPGTGRRGILRDAAAAALFAGLASCLRAHANGDRVIWLQFPYLNYAYLSEGLGAALQHAAHAVGGMEGQRALPPLLGGLACFAWLRTAAALRPTTSPAARAVVGLAWLASPVVLVFGYDFVENAQAALPAALAALPALVRAADGARPDAERRRAAAVAGAWFGVSASTHGSALFVAPAVFCAIAATSRGRGRAALCDAAAALGAFAAVVAAAFGLLAAVGFELVVGHAAGGADGLFVPWSAAGAGATVRYGFMDLAHWRDAAQVVVFAAPLAVFALPLRRGAAVAAALLWPPLGHAGFALLWNFDLGFPIDFDLMLGLGVVGQLRAALVVADAAERGGRRGRVGAALALAAAAALSWPLVGALSSSRFDDAGAANAAGAALRVGGLGADGVAGPFTAPVDAARPETELVVEGPPGTDGLLLVGPRAPYPLRLPRMGTLHVGRGASNMGLDDPSLTRFPIRFDAEGVYRYRFVHAPVPPGPIPGFEAVQAVLLPPAGSRAAPRLTAAFHLEAR